MKKTDVVPPAVVAARSSYLTQTNIVTKLKNEIAELREKQSAFEENKALLGQQTKDLQQNKTELEIAVGTGSASLSDVGQLNKQLSEIREKFESLDNIIKTISVALDEKDKELEKHNNRQQQLRRDFLNRIIDAVIVDIRPSLRLLFAAHKTVGGGVTHFDQLMGDMVRAADIRDLSDQKEILAERFGFAD